MPDLTVEYLKSILHYDPISGVFTWLTSRSYSKNAQPGSKAGSLSSNGYIEISIRDRKYKAHRLAWLYMTGEFPEGMLDHKDRVRANNRWNNLRKATRRQNAANCDNSKSNKTSLRGVRQHGQRFVARITVYGKRRHLGVFDTAELAYAAYDAAARSEFGEFYSEKKHVHVQAA